MILAIHRERVRQQLIHHEGIRLKPYRDSVGKLTIGVGRNLDDRGIAIQEAFTLLDNDIDTAAMDLAREYPWVADLDPVRQAVLIDMSFNLGIARLKKFVNTLAAVQRGDYEAAAEGMRRSKWASQVGRRAVRLRQMMTTGEWPGDIAL